MTAQETENRTERPRGPEPDSRAFAITLLVISLLAAIPRVLLGKSQFVEYDGYWHVFIAQQDNWARFWDDVYRNAHPPLFFLLLKAALRFGRNLLVYRSISIVSGVTSVFLVGWIARKVTGSRMRAYQSALAFGFAMAAIIISCEVRSYSLSVVFVLASFSCLIDILREDDGPVAWKARGCFAVWAILACLSEYFAFFYAGAALLLLFGRFVFGGKKSRWWVELLTGVPVLATIGVLYGGHAGHMATVYGHLLPYYFDPHGKESVLAFVLRNSRNFLDPFLPVEISSPNVVLSIGFLAMAAGLIVAFRLKRWPATTRTAAQATFLVTAITLGAIIAAAIAGKYPYGGDMRQQFLVFPFLVLCLAIVVERFAQSLGRFVGARGRMAANLCLAGLAAGAGIGQYIHYPKNSVNVLAPQMAAFDRMTSNPLAVYVDQFNLITFFIYHHDWKWKLDTEQPVKGIDIYTLKKGDRRMEVFRDVARWNTDPDEAPVFGEMAALLRTRQIPSVSTFEVRQMQAKPPFSNVRGVEEEILNEASASAVCVDQMSVASTWWYVTLQRSDCRPIRLPAPGDASSKPIAGSVDDTDEGIAYVGKWDHGDFAGARNATLSYSNDAGAIARATFRGGQITWVHSKAFNRGIAEVRIDGVSQGKFDLYTRKIVWQAEDTFKAPRPGVHTFEVIVTAEKNPLASDHFADVDGLIVK